MTTRHALTDKRRLFRKVPDFQMIPGARLTVCSKLTTEAFHVLDFHPHINAEKEVWHDTGKLAYVIVKHLLRQHLSLANRVAHKA